MVTRPVPEQRVGGRYVLREQVGRGGFGVVWRAHDSLLRRDVAVKAIEFPPILDDAEQAAIRTKVLREAQAAARLNHPGLITVFDVIEEDGRPLIVMELVRAPTLADLVARTGPLAEQQVASIGRDVLDALGAAHGQGIIHRDVKPANVMVSESGHVQLGDFGIAAVIDDPKLTNSGTLAGSPSYMAPEQAENRAPTAATDLWGLGATLYFAVEAEPPFAGSGAIATLTSVVNAPHRPLRRAGALAPLIDALLAKDPAGRPTAAEARRRLTDIVSGAPPAEPRDLTAEFDPRGDWDYRPAAPAAGSTTEHRRAATRSPATDAKAPGGMPASPTTASPTTGIEPEARPAPAPSPADTAPVGRPPAERGDPAPIIGHEARASRPRSLPIVPLVLGIVVLVAVIVVAVVAGRGGGGPKAAAPGSSAPTPTSSAPSAAGRPATATDAAVPKDWVEYRDPATGYSIAHPPQWSVTKNGTLTDFHDPASGAYLRVDHREPPGPSPEGAWYEFEPSFSAQNANYKRVQITPTTYEGYRAAVWEYTYSGGGGDLRAVDLGFIAGSHGFALNFQAAASDWDRLQPIFAAFKASFKAPSA